jgi:hypothetical protein
MPARKILERHHARVAEHPLQNHCTHTRLLLGPHALRVEIITATRSLPDSEELLTIMCLAEEWSAVTHDEVHQCPSASAREN